MKQSIILNLPNELLETSKSLKQIGISNLAWNWENVIKVILFLKKSNYLILGGDVYKNTNDKLESTFDSWYYNTCTKDLVTESCNKAINYINEYHNKNGNGFYYSSVIKKIV